MNVPAFIDLDESSQILELRSFLRAQGAEIAEEASDRGTVTDLLHIIEASSSLWNEAGSSSSESDIETVYNSIISLILTVQPEKCENVVVLFCEKVTKCQTGDKQSLLRVKLLNNLYHALMDDSYLRYIVFYHLIKLCGQVDSMHAVQTEVSDLKELCQKWEVSVQKYQNLLRITHESLIASKQGEKSTKVMIELLGTYTDDNASQARDDAHKCIVTCLGDPSTFLLDHLLALKPVKFLEGELIHDLLNIFVSGTLEDYMNFCKSNSNFINTLGLNHQENIKKMRLLTFMQMAENKKEIDFETIEKKLQLDRTEIEHFIIDVVKTKAVHCKINQLKKSVDIQSTTHRTFTKQHWMNLRNRFLMWHEQLGGIRTSLMTLAPPAEPGKPGQHW